MDSLRISLIIIGIIILLALYFGSQFLSKKRQLKQQPRQAPLFDETAAGDQKSIPDAEISDVPILAERETACEPKEAEVEVVQAETPPTDDTAAPTPAAAQSTIPAVIALHIVAKQDDFVGADLVKAANLAAMRYGEMEIFHFLGATQGAITFSMANMLEPGTFDLDNLNGFTTPGVLLFMESDLQDDLTASLNSMAKVAKNICERLDAQLCDERRRPFDIQQLDAWKADLLNNS